MKYFLLVILIISSTALADDVAKTDVEIKFIMGHVKNFSFIFIRNGKEHSGEDAYKHMMKKYKYFKDKINNAESFIGFTLTKSTMTGEKYKIKLSDSKILLSQNYFLEKLELFRAGL